MRSNAVSEIDSVNYPPLVEVDNGQGPSVRAWQTHSGVTVDRDKSPLAIRGHGDFVPGHAAFRDVRILTSRNGVNQAQGLVALVSNQQQAAW